VPACERILHTSSENNDSEKLEQVEAENIDYPTKRELVEILADLRKA
jgi:hypothetical protein